MNSEDNGESIDAIRRRLAEAVSDEEAGHDEMQELGWDEHTPQVWRSQLGHVWMTSPDSSLAGEVRVALSRRLVVMVDRWDFSRVVSFELIPDGQGSMLTSDERRALQALGAEDLTLLIESDHEGSIQALPVLPSNMRELVAGIALGEHLHPIWFVEAVRQAQVSAGLSFVEHQLDWQLAPTVEALRSAISIAFQSDLLFTEAANIDRLLAAQTVDEVVERITVSEQSRDAMCQLLTQRALRSLSTDSAHRDRPLEETALPSFDIVNLDEIERAWSRVDDGYADVTVVVLDDELVVWASVVTMLGVHSSTKVSFAGGSRSSTVRLPVPDFDYWIELHPEPHADSTLRPDRARRYASELCAQAIAPLQAAAGVIPLGVFQSREDLQLQLLDAAGIFDEIADEPGHAESARQVAAAIASGRLGDDPVVQDWPTLRASQLLIAAQPVISAALQSDRIGIENRLALKPLVAGPSSLGSGQPSPAITPDFVPIDWIVEEFARNLPAAPFPDRAMARSMNSEDDTSHRVELDDEQLDATGISSIVIEFKAQTVTVTVTRDRNRADYALRITEGGESLATAHSENPIADVYVAEFSGDRGGVRVEFKLGPNQ